MEKHPDNEIVIKKSPGYDKNRGKMIIKILIPWSYRCARKVMEGLVEEARKGGLPGVDKNYYAGISKNVSQIGNLHYIRNMTEEQVDRVIEASNIDAALGWKGRKHREELLFAENESRKHVERHFAMEESLSPESESPAP